jgi:hypothetical protein
MERSILVERKFGRGDIDTPPGFAFAGMTGELTIGKSR